MRELSLFSGAGGGLLATKHLLGWETIGYVEWDKYCQKVLRQRILDGYLDNAPIFGDIREFLDTGCAELYQGVTDVVTAGFPCQPFSVAGKRKAEADERNQWPNVVECLRMVRPQYVWLENVPGFLATEYIWQIADDLSTAGYDFKWTIMGADDVGAPHRRKRWWCLAESKALGLEDIIETGTKTRATDRGS